MPATFPSRESDTAALAAVADEASARAAHEAATADVHGIEDVATLVVDSDERLSDARTPLPHGHPQSEITGLTTALSGKVSTALVGAPDGIATLDSDGLIPEDTLPFRPGQPYTSADVFADYEAGAVPVGRKRDGTASGTHIHAHRFGGPFNLPDNALSSMGASVASGFRFIDGGDWRLILTGQYFTMHDDGSGALLRTTDWEGLDELYDLPLEVVKGIRVDHGPVFLNPNMPTEPIPSLDDVLGEAKRLGITITPDVENATDMAAIVARIQAYGLENQVYMIASNGTVETLQPAIDAGLPAHMPTALADPITSNPASLVAAGVTSIGYDHRSNVQTPAALKAAYDAGLLLWTQAHWRYEVDQLQALADAYGFRWFMFMSNDPQFCSRHPDYPRLTSDPFALGAFTPGMWNPDNSASDSSSVRRNWIQVEADGTGKLMFDYGSGQSISCPLGFFGGDTQQTSITWRHTFEVLPESSTGRDEALCFAAPDDRQVRLSTTYKGQGYVGLWSADGSLEIARLDMTAPAYASGVVRTTDTGTFTSLKTSAAGFGTVATAGTPIERKLEIRPDNKVRLTDVTKGVYIETDTADTTYRGGYCYALRRNGSGGSYSTSFHNMSQVFV